MTRRASKRSKSAYHHGDLRAALVAAAIRLIEARKDASFTIREIAARAGVTHTAAYRHFSNKRSLLAAVAAEGFGLLVEEFTRKLKLHRGASIPEQLQLLGLAYVQFAHKNTGHFRAMFHSDLGARSDFPSLEASSGAAFGTLRTLIERGMAAGVFVGSSVDAVTLTAWSVVHGFSLLSLDQLPRKFPQQASKAWINDLTEEVVHAIQPGILPRR